MHTNPEDDEESSTEDGLLPKTYNDTKKKKKQGMRHRLARTLGLGNKQIPNGSASHPHDIPSQGYASALKDSAISFVPSGLAPRTLQEYHGGPNEERTEYMEQHSALREKNLAVSVEQVSIFLRANNTVVSFFEHSSTQDIENPILTRLSSQETVLRRSSDASMVVQAIIDAIIDLAIPVTAAYKDALDELELRVLTGKKPYVYLQINLIQVQRSKGPQCQFSLYYHQ